MPSVGERTSYAPGTFCWVDLGTTDPDGAKRFYGELFGWEMEDFPGGDGGTYTVLRVDGKDVGGLYEQPEEQREQGVPPNWASYVSVEDVDESAARAGELGGTVLAEPFDVEGGRTAVIQDPQGATFALWQPGGNFGAHLVNAPGALCLNQLNAVDPEKAQAFYGALFGWRFEVASEEGGPEYVGIYIGDAVNAGMMPMPPEASGAPSHWLAYFAIEGLDGANERIGDLGGSVIVPPMEIPNGGHILVAQDPQGASFALYEGYLDP
jgi:uncharacterized protein